MICTYADPMRVRIPGERELKMDSKPPRDESTPDVEPPSKPFKTESPPILVTVERRLYNQRIIIERGR